jgi:hypothetical protein
MSQWPQPDPYEQYSQSYATQPGQHGYQTPYPPATPYAGPNFYPPAAPYPPAGSYPPPNSPYPPNTLYSNVPPRPPIAPYPPATPEIGRGFALAGLILGIFALLTSPVPFFGLPITIVGIVLSSVGRRSWSRRKMATWGLVLCIIALVMTVGWAVWGATRYVYLH